MKKLLIFLVLVFFCTLGGQSVFAYTYDTSSINPKVVLEWEIIGSSPVNDAGMYFLVGRNPEPKHPVRYVLFEIYFPADRMLMRFSYYEDGKLLVYKAVGRGHYQKIVPTPVDLENARQWLDPASLYDTGE